MSREKKKKKDHYLNMHLLKTDDDDDRFLATPKFNGHNRGWWYMGRTSYVGPNDVFGAREITFRTPIGLLYFFGAGLCPKGSDPHIRRGPLEKPFPYRPKGSNPQIRRSPLEKPLPYSPTGSNPQIRRGPLEKPLPYSPTGSDSQIRRGPLKKPFPYMYMATSRP
jgi:hypothetical protein